MLNESNIINQLKNSFPEYIGDDAAVLSVHFNENYVITKDLLIEDVHFRSNYFDAASLAHKALQVNLSDLAAMGARPKFVLCGIAIPLSHEKYAQEFLEQFAISCKKSEIIIIGGDTTRSPDKLFVSITAIGVGSHGHLKYRHTAKSEDLICIAGKLGEAHLGLVACERGLSDFEHYKNSLLRPQAKIAEGLWLAAQSSVHSMMDISDGLVVDLKRLCEASSLQANIRLEKIKLSETFIEHCQIVGLEAIEISLIGAEDYSLLFTVAPEAFSNVTASFKKQFGYDIQCIGHLSRGVGIQFTENGLSKNLKLQPFSHFGEDL